MITEFTHTISQSEWKSKYLNLRDDEEKGYGEQFPPHGTRLAIIDDSERQFSATKHHESQIWGNLQSWFGANQIRPQTVIKVRYDTDENAPTGEPIVRLLLQSRAPIEARPIETYGEEIEGGKAVAEIPLSFEKQLEDFLELNPELIETGLRLFVDENSNRGRQYPTDVGTIDLLFVKPSGDLVVVELKRARGSDEVVGQISRYIGWVKHHIAGDEAVYGVIITHEYDPKLKYAVEGNEKLALKYYRIRIEFVDEAQVKSQQ